MAEQEQNPEGQIQYLLSDFNTRLRDFDERGQLIRERVLLLGKNLIESKQSLEEDIHELKKQTAENSKELEKLKALSKNIVRETEKFVKRDETRIIERMLKDFQPLEFMRRKDVEELIEEKLTKQIKTTKTTKEQ